MKFSPLIISYSGRRTIVLPPTKSGVLAARSCFLLCSESYSNVFGSKYTTDLHSLPPTSTIGSSLKVRCCIGRVTILWICHMKVEVDIQRFGESLVGLTATQANRILNAFDPPDFLWMQSHVQDSEKPEPGASFPGATTSSMPQCYPNLPHEAFTFGHCAATITPNPTVGIRALS
jgi:hypothetical protein